MQIIKTNKGEKFSYLMKGIIQIKSKDTKFNKLENLLLNLKSLQLKK